MASTYFSASIPDVRGLGQQLGETASTVSSGAVFIGVAPCSVCAVLSGPR